jgi:hypothetical protein
MKYLPLLFLCSLTAQAEFLELKDVYLNGRFVQGSRDPLYSFSPKKENFDLGVNVDLATFIGVDTVFHSGTDQTQFHYGGLEFRTYLRLSDQLTVGWWHQSLHIFDDRMRHMDFPFEDSLEVRVKIYTGKGRREAIIP